MDVVKEIASEDQESILLSGSMFVPMTEAVLNEELSVAQKSLPFVGLRYFVREWLGKKGYDYDSSYTLINYLEDKGVVKLTKMENSDLEYPTTVIALAEENRVNI